MKIEEFINKIQGLGYTILVKELTGEDIMLIGRAYKPQYMAPVADVSLTNFGEYNIAYTSFNQELDTVEQIQLSSLLVQFVNTPIMER